MAAFRDDEAIIPLIRDRRCEEYDQARDVTTFVHYPIANDDKEKVKLHVKKASGAWNEDVEATLSTFIQFREAMKKKKLWDDGTFTQTKDVAILFEYWSECLDGSLQRDMQQIRKEYASDDTWKGFKEQIAAFITTKVCVAHHDPYQAQVNYMYERTMPRELNSEEYWKRLLFCDYCLPLLLDRDAMEDKSGGTVKQFKSLWSWGSLGDHQLIDLFKRKVPIRWLNRFREMHSFQESRMTVQQVLHAFGSIESAEAHQNNRLAAAARGGSRRQQQAQQQRYQQSYYGQQSDHEDRPQGEEIFLPQSEMPLLSREDRYVPPVGRQHQRFPFRSSQSGRQPFQSGRNNRNQYQYQPRRPAFAQHGPSMPGGGRGSPLTGRGQDRQDQDHQRFRSPFYGNSDRSARQPLQPEQYHHYEEAIDDDAQQQDQEEDELHQINETEEEQDWANVPDEEFLAQEDEWTGLGFDAPYYEDGTETEHV